MVRALGASTRVVGVRALGASTLSSKARIVDLRMGQDSLTAGLGPSGIGLAWRALCIVYFSIGGFGVCRGNVSKDTAPCGGNDGTLSKSCRAMDSSSQATGSDSCANVARTLQNSPLFQATGEIFSRLVACGHHVSVISRYRRQILPASELGQQCQWFRSQTSKKQLSLDSRWHLHTDHGCQ